MKDTVSGLSGPLGHDFSGVARHLLSLPEGRCVYIANPGNAGDSVIATGTFALFERSGFVPEIGSIYGSYPDAHVIFGGGGNLIEGTYDRAATFIDRHRGICRSLTVLPSSVRGNEKMLGGLDERCTIFAREAVTRDHVRRHAVRAQVPFAHDMAFMNDFDRFDELLRSPLLRGARPFGPGWARQLRTLGRWRLERLRRRRGPLPPPGRVLNAFRTDSERTGDEIPEGNSDLSIHFRPVKVPSPFMTGQVVDAFVRTIRRFETVRTNRLHVAITAALLGKEVEMHDNSYGKLAGVHAASMADLPNVRFIR